jgi:adenylate kinase family enzyme
VKRIFLLGPTGSERKEYAKRLKDQFNLTFIETSDLLSKEATKDTPQGKKIKAA